MLHEEIKSVQLTLPIEQPVPLASSEQHVYRLSIELPTGGKG